MAEREEGTWDEHWVLNVSDEPQESTPKTESALYSQVDNKLYFFLRKKIYRQCRIIRDHDNYPLVTSA